MVLCISSCCGKSELQPRCLGSNSHKAVPTKEDFLHGEVKIEFRFFSWNLSYYLKLKLISAQTGKI